MRHETKNIYSPAKIPKNPPTQKYERNNGLLTHNSMTGTIHVVSNPPTPAVPHLPSSKGPGRLKDVLIFPRTCLFEYQSS